MNDKSTHVWPEIVKILDDRRLVDSRSGICTYRRRDGKGLAPGLYVAVRQPAGFDEDAEFRGPFRCVDDAHAALERLATLIVSRLRPDRIRRGVAPSAKEAPPIGPTAPRRA